MVGLSALEESILLIIMVNNGEAYGVSVADEYKRQLGKSISIPSVHTVLERLESKGLISSSEGGATAIRGGRRKRLLSLTKQGYEALRKVNNKRQEFWQLPSALSYIKKWGE